MDRTSRNLLFFLLVQIAAYSVFSLHCFDCHSSQLSSECESDVDELNKGVFSKFALNCSNLNNVSNPVCAIEIRKTNGEIKKIMRSCSDGKSFNFNPKLHQLQNMKFLNPKSNNTVCSLHEGITCISICDTNMCNGPKDAITSFNSSGIMVSSGTNVLGVISLFYNIFYTPLFSSPFL